MSQTSPNSALIVAAGRGSRARSADDDAPKQYALIGGLPVLTHTLSVFLAHRDIDLIQVVIHEDDKSLYAHAVDCLAQNIKRSGERTLLPFVFGGATRQASVRQGLDALNDHAPGTVLVHDAARPFVAANTITAVLTALGTHQGAIAALPLSDTLKRAAADGTIEQTVERTGLWRAQTPQGFHFADLYKAHHDALSAGETLFTDDAAVAEWAGLNVVLVEGSARNIKLTTAEDLIMADKSLQRTHAQAASAHGGQTLPGLPAIDVRTGNGFDVHRFAPGAHVWLGGVKIPHDKSLEGHSDADVALHALTDALLGAIGDGDIGAHFPPSDPQWKGASSDQFLADAGRRITRLGAIINNVDVTILCEEPKIGPHRDAMRSAIANILQLDVTRVSVKATTTERLGFTGRGEGIAAMASASVTMAPRS